MMYKLTPPGRAVFCASCFGWGFVAIAVSYGYKTAGKQFGCLDCHGTGCVPVSSDEIEREFYCDTIGGE